MPTGADSILREAKRLGFSVDQVFRASKVLGVDKFKMGFGMGWQWQLPREQSTSATEKATSGRSAIDGLPIDLPFPIDRKF